MIFLSIILTPLAWAFSWFAFACGYLAYFILQLNLESGLWINIWYPPYNEAMFISNEVQTWACGTSAWWPWQDINGDEQ